MKKLLAVGFSAMLLLTACGEEETKEETTAANTDTAATEENSDQNTDIKKELMRFYMSVPQAINKVDADLNTFEVNQAEATLPEGADLQAMKDAAKGSAEQAAVQTAEIEIPETLADQQEDFESALGLITESYDMKAEELTKEEASFEAANAKFEEADAIFNKHLEEQGLAASSIYNEVTN